MKANEEMFQYKKLSSDWIKHIQAYLLSWHQVLCEGSPYLRGLWCASPAPDVITTQSLD